MENATTAAVVVAGFFFSVMCALLMEELIFGGMFRIFFAPRAVRCTSPAKVPHQPKEG